VSIKFHRFHIEDIFVIIVIVNIVHNVSNIYALTFEHMSKLAYKNKYPTKYNNFTVYSLYNTQNCSQALR